MAIISIPSSVGGVTIPGITNIPGGPLGVLFGNSKQLGTYQYPRDLGSATKGHIVQFAIKEIKPINFEEGTGLSGALNSVVNDTVSGKNQSWQAQGKKLDDAFKNTSIGSSIQRIASDFGGAISKGESFQIGLSQRQQQVKSTISLYIPDTVNISSDISFGETSLVKVAAGIADKGINALGSGLANAAGKFSQGAKKEVQRSIPKNLTTTVLNSDLTKLALAASGLAINPQEQILFNGIGFRSPQLAFTFTPYSREEARIVRNIIREFRLAAAPEILPGKAGMFFRPPSVFTIKFLLNNRINPYITQLADCVITSIDVNYAPNGWSSHSDGAPVQTTLTIQFKELQLIDKNKINQGF